MGTGAEESYGGHERRFRALMSAETWLGCSLYTSLDVVVILNIDSLFIQSILSRHEVYYHHHHRASE